MKNIKRTIPQYLAFDYEGIEQYLESMHRKGWALDKIGTWLWTFRRTEQPAPADPASQAGQPTSATPTYQSDQPEPAGRAAPASPASQTGQPSPAAPTSPADPTYQPEPADVHYSVIYLPKASAYSPDTDDRLSDLEEFCRQSGWIRVAGRDTMQIFRSGAEVPAPTDATPNPGDAGQTPTPADEPTTSIPADRSTGPAPTRADQAPAPFEADGAPVPIETDETVRLQSIRAGMRKSFVYPYVLLLLVLLVNGSLNTLTNPVYLFSSYSGLFGCGAMIIAFFTILFSLCAYGVWLRKSIRSVSEGGRCASTAKAGRVQKYASFAALICVAIYLISLAIESEGSSAAYVVAYVVLIMAAAAAVRKLSAKLREKGLAGGTNIAVSTGVCVLLAGGITAGLAAGLFFTEDTRTATAKPAEMPVTIQDIRDTKQTAFEYTWRSTATAFMSREQGEQSAVSDAGRISDSAATEAGDSTATGTSDSAATGTSDSAATGISDSAATEAGDSAEDEAIYDDAAGMNYEILRIPESSSLYRPCLKHYLKGGGVVDGLMGTYADEGFCKISNKGWGTSAAWQYCYGDVEDTEWLLAYPDKIVKLTLYWEPTDAELQKLARAFAEV